MIAVIRMARKGCTKILSTIGMIDIHSSPCFLRDQLVRPAIQLFCEGTYECFLLFVSIYQAMSSG